METANAEIILDRTRPVDLSGYEKYNLFQPSTCTEPVTSSKLTLAQSSLRVEGGRGGREGGGVL